MCAYLRLDSIKENIEGDANLHQPPRNRVKGSEGFFVTEKFDRFHLLETCFQITDLSIIIVSLRFTKIFFTSKMRNVTCFKCRNVS